MVRADECHPRWKTIDEPVPETRRRRGQSVPQVAARFEILVERDLAQGYHDADLPQEAKFFQQIRAAIVELGWQGLVVRRGATDDGRDITVGELKPIVLVDGLRLIREAKAVQRLI